MPAVTISRGMLEVLKNRALIFQKNNMFLPGVGDLLVAMC